MESKLVYYRGKRLKPLIRLTYSWYRGQGSSYWICTHESFLGRGAGFTPKEAYDSWVELITKQNVFTNTVDPLGLSPHNPPT